MRRRGFTLIELLVVIVIIAVIIAILLPGLGSARATSKTLVCGSKLHQLGVATSLYLGDFNNALPQMKGPLPQGGEGFVGGLFGGMVILPIHAAGGSSAFVHHGGRIPAPLSSLRN